MTAYSLWLEISLIRHLRSRSKPCKSTHKEILMVLKNIFFKLEMGTSYNDDFAKVKYLWRGLCVNESHRLVPRAMNGPWFLYVCTFCPVCFWNVYFISFISCDVKLRLSFHFRFPPTSACLSLSSVSNPTRYDTASARLPGYSHPLLEHHHKL